jgi:hypothetical protein
MSIRPTRRSLAFVLATVALAVPGLTGCGFDAATERPYTPATGANDVSGVVDVLGAVVVSSASGSGTFVATLANNDQQESQTFSALTGGTGTELTVTDFDPIEIARGGAVNLADDGGIPVSGDFAAGNFVSVVLGFDSGERVSMQVPVVPNSGIYEGLDGAPSEVPSETADTETTE